MGRVSFKDHDLVGVIVKKKLSESKWELLGSFEDNLVYKRIKDKKNATEE